MKYFLHGLLVLSVVFAAGCASHPHSRLTGVKFSNVSTWPSFYLQNHQRLQSLTSQSQISLETPNLAATITASFIYVAPDTLFLQVEGFLGMDLGKIFIGKDRFILYNQFNNQFIAGDIDDPHYNTFLETNLTLSQIKQAVIGFTSLPENLVLVDEEQGLFSSLENQQERRYKVNKRTGALEWVEIIIDGKLELRQEFKNYTTMDGVLFPRLTRIILPQRKEMVALFHKNIKINEDIDRKAYFIEIGPRTKQLIIAN